MVNKLTKKCSNHLSSGKFKLKLSLTRMINMKKTKNTSFDNYMEQLKLSCTNGRRIN